MLQAAPPLGGKEGKPVSAPQLQMCSRRSVRRKAGLHGCATNGGRVAEHRHAAPLPAPPPQPPHLVLHRLARAPHKLLAPRDLALDLGLRAPLRRGALRGAAQRLELLLAPRHDASGEALAVARHAREAALLDDVALPRLAVLLQHHLLLLLVQLRVLLHARLVVRLDQRRLLLAARALHVVHRLHQALQLALKVGLLLQALSDDILLCWRGGGCGLCV